MLKMSEYKNENLTKFWVLYVEKSEENITTFLAKTFRVSFSLWLSRNAPKHTTVCCKFTRKCYHTNY